MEEQVKPYCPLEGTNLEGFCVEEYGEVRQKEPICTHAEHCQQFKKQLEALETE
jgi:hypothetical protein